VSHQALDLAGRPGAVGGLRTGGAAVRPAPGLEVVLTGTSSDAHTWNLVYLHLVLEELGCTVTNLGACTPDETVVEVCAERRPGLLVVGSLNGHARADGSRLIAALRARPETSRTPAAIGGKLDISGGEGATVGALLAAGFDAVFDEAAGIAGFREFVGALAPRAAAAVAGPGPRGIGTA
jgi:methylaspartate mutase sigma subunit